MSGLPVAGVVDAAGIEVAHKQTGASAVAARKGIKAGDVVVRLPGPSDPPRIGRCSIVRLVPWMAEPEAVVTPVAVTIPTNATMAMAGIAPDRVLIQTVVTSVAVVAAIVVTTTPSATLPVVDPMGRSDVIHVLYFGFLDGFRQRQSSGYCYLPTYQGRFSDFWSSLITGSSVNERGRFCWSKRFVRTLTLM